jgi:hypothetical protein
MSLPLSIGGVITADLTPAILFLKVIIIADVHYP